MREKGGRLGIPWDEALPVICHGLLSVTNGSHLIKDTLNKTADNLCVTKRAAGVSGSKSTH